MRALAWCALVALAVGLDAACDCDHPPLEPNPEKCRCPKVRRTTRSVVYGPLNWHIPEFRHVISTTPVPFPSVADILGVYYLPAEAYRSNEEKSYVIKPKRYLDHIQLKNEYPDSIVSPSEVHFRDVQNHKDYFLDKIQPKYPYSASHPTSAFEEQTLEKSDFTYRQKPENYFLNQIQPAYTFSSLNPFVTQPNRNEELKDVQNSRDYFLNQIQPEYTYSASHLATGEPIQSKGEFTHAKKTKDYFIDQVQPEYTITSPYHTTTFVQPTPNKDDFTHRQGPKNYFSDQVQPEYTISSSIPVIDQSSLRNREFRYGQNSKDFLLKQVQPEYTFISPYSSSIYNQPSRGQFRDALNKDQIQLAQTHSTSHRAFVAGQPIESKSEFRDCKNKKEPFMDKVQPEYTLNYPYSTSNVAQPSLRNGEFRDGQNPKDYFLDQAQPEFSFPFSNSDIDHLSYGEFKAAPNSNDYLLDQIQPKYTYSAPHANAVTDQPILSKETFRGTQNSKDYFSEQIQPAHKGSISSTNAHQANPSEGEFKDPKNSENYFINHVQPEYMFSSLYPNPVSAQLTQTQPEFIMPYLGGDSVPVQSGPSQTKFRENQNQIQTGIIIPHHGADSVIAQSVPNQAQFKDNQNQNKHFFKQIIPEYIIPYPSADPVVIQLGPSHAQFRDNHKEKNYYLDQTQLQHDLPHPGIYHVAAQTPDINEGKFRDIQNKKKSYADNVQPENLILQPAVDNENLVQITQSQFGDDLNPKAKTFNKNIKNYVPYRTFSENPDYFLDQIQLTDKSRKVNLETPINVSESSSRREFRDSLDNTREYLDVSFDGEPSQSRSSESDLEILQNAMMNCMDLQLLLLMNTSKVDDVQKSFWNKAHTEGIVNDHQLRRQIRLKCQDAERTFEDSVQDITKSKINQSSDTRNIFLKLNETNSQNFTSRAINEAGKGVKLSNSTSEMVSELEEEFSSNKTEKVKHFVDYENQSPRSDEYEDDNSKYDDMVTEIVMNSILFDHSTIRPSIEPIFNITPMPLARRKRTRRSNGDEELRYAVSNEISSESSEKNPVDGVRISDSLTERSKIISDKNKISTAPRDKRPMYKQSELKIPTVEIRELATGAIVVRKGIEKLPNSDVFPSEVDAKNTLPKPIIKTKDENESTDIEKIPMKVLENLGDKHITETVELPILKIDKLNEDESRTTIGKFPLVIVESDDKKNEYSKKKDDDKDALLGGLDERKHPRTQMIYGKLVFVGGETDEIPLRATQLRNGTIQFDVMEKDQRGLCERLASRIKSNSAFMYALCKAVNADKAGL